MDYWKLLFMCFGGYWATVVRSMGIRKAQRTYIIFFLPCRRTLKGDSAGSCTHRRLKQFSFEDGEHQGLKVFMEKAFGKFGRVSFPWVHLKDRKDRLLFFSCCCCFADKPEKEKGRSFSGQFHGNILSFSHDATTSRLFFAVMNVNVKGN